MLKRDSRTTSLATWRGRRNLLGTGPHDQPRPVVLLAVSDESEADDALLRARVLCDVFDSDLFLLRVVSGLEEAAVEPCDATPVRKAGPKAIASAARWWRRVLGEQLPNERFGISCGDFASAVRFGAEALQASLLVVSGPETSDGAFVRGVVRDTVTPVLVARHLGDGSTVIATTDLTDTRFPVLRLGQRIARGQVAPLVFMHNAGSTGSKPSSQQAFRRSLVSLEDIGRELKSECPRVTANHLDSADAILELAERQHADLIVVGTHVRTSHRRAPERASVARQVVNRAVNSVLVVPVGV